MSNKERVKPPCEHCGGNVQEYMQGMYYQGWKCLECKKLTWEPQEWTTQPSPVEQMKSRIQQLEEALEKIASAYQHMTLKERLVGEPSPARLVLIADAALASLGSLSEAPEKEE